MLKVWGRPDSSNVAKVMWAVGELGLPCERIDLGGKFGGNDDPVYRSKNPHGRIPTLEDGDAVLWESNAIVRYLAGRYGSGLLPADLAERAASDRWMDWCSITLVPRLKNLRDVHRAGGDTTALLEDVFAMVSTLEAALAETDFIAGNELTVGDIALGAQVHRWVELDIAKPAFPKVVAYRDRLLQRPAFVEHVAKPVKL
ncbi:MAG: glutathione S-transferase N-terminal domain-containing protein [Chelatococcus sp.]|uniref:glutathione S-transferase family protein n=1 Tax=unclassified Chelatococcus TaxID=2638111 RepID=UPI001BCD335B|nr:MULTISPECIES: glutathione S-transferase N-terminal domain-containing protein [unclassified Chelatococcus]MBS7740254.1 glutathione S-transferase N-terminal domain-containing protein [Chelatococcus sp. HY11]MBX3540957.1 glutathione S-transferase N-terminal domain-containing protein [Chelatococcus sp.]MBX3544917.1 glutathione S-transferase N-terminal domain-containing protein [Chelatococcus sp.]MCO5078505.1 glutathione S-transferase N-terminal domain-containing protein [Chelatococcus sp.]